MVKKKESGHEPRNIDGPEKVEKTGEGILPYSVRKGR